MDLQNAVLGKKSSIMSCQCLIVFSHNHPSKLECIADPASLYHSAGRGLRHCTHHAALPKSPTEGLLARQNAAPRSAHPKGQEC